MSFKTSGERMVTIETAPVQVFYTCCKVLTLTLAFFPATAALLLRQTDQNSIEYIDSLSPTHNLLSHRETNIWANEVHLSACGWLAEKNL